eukprot:TRINITY_DN7131_c0_g1_i1.p1 TRINITY_DN7131_c0_g1~~TRINITY_DN7131_c0_g1_i1.p1  ORF type:complete len:274 (+),score=45.24 TRINITY_DN7131_c0_g1_i1:156-977(+)
MKNQNKTIFFLFFVIIFSHSFIRAVMGTAEGVEEEREFDYERSGGKGPLHWGELKKEWAACKKGEMQSPIDLSNQRVRIIPNLSKLRRSYKPSNATIKNRGHDISLQWDIGKAGSIMINGTEYFLHQCHWHSPSEHTVNGRKYDMEMHMVHLSKDEKIAVVGLLYNRGNPDPFLSKLMTPITAISDKKEEMHLGMIDPTEINPLSGEDYYRYIGSLTVPPCTEGVIWTISKQIRTISVKQVKQLRIAVDDYAEQNARPVQAINTRQVQLMNAN